MPEARAWEALSIADRLEQIRGALTEIEFCILQSSIQSIVGNDDFTAVGVFDVLRWWALSGYSANGIMEFSETYKLQDGQTHFALHFFKEALATKRLSYSFRCAIQSVTDANNLVTVVTNDRRVFSGRRVISTMPLNTMREVQFNPALDTLRNEATELGQVHKGMKMHFEIDKAEKRPLMAVSHSQSPIVNGLGDGKTESNGCRHLIVFGKTKSSLDNLSIGRSFETAARNILPNLPIKKVVSNSR